MGKFAIACPKCGKYAEGNTGLFSKKRIECSCGNIIDVRLEKLTSKKCQYCGNQVVYDQTKGSDALCPVCHEKINTLSDQQKLRTFHCKQCSILLSTVATATTFTCPVCDYENDVQKCLIIERIKQEGSARIIKYEGDNNIFIWKYPLEDFCYGSQLIVHESQEAIFFYDGQALDLFGPGRYTLESQHLPLLEKARHLSTNANGIFHSEVYFINKTTQMGIKWGTPERVRFIDPLTGVPLQLGASGEMNMQVSDSRKLLVKLVGSMRGIAWDDEPGLSKSIQSSFRPLIINAVKVNLPAVINRDAIDILEIDAKLDIISSDLLKAILPGFEEYGLTIPQLYVTNVVLPEEDPNFKRIRELHTISLQTRLFQAEATVKAAKAQSETMYRTVEEQSRATIEAARRDAELQRQSTETEIAKHKAERRILEAQADAQAHRMAGLAEADIMQAKGYSQRDVIQSEIQKTYAESIGNMGPFVTGSGNGTSGSSIVSDMLGMGVGMAAASAIAPQLGGMMQSLNPHLYQLGNSPTIMNSWSCSCGQKGIIGNFCGNCGSRKPMTTIGNTWDCVCGQKGITGNFCSNCGARKPQTQFETWDCSCGRKGIIGKYCDNCGKKKDA